MNQRFTYSIPPHTLSFPATADRICVAEPRPHTYGVRHLPCGPLATEPCRPTACNPSIPPHTLSFPATADRISAEVFQLTRVSARTQTPPTPHPCSLFYPTANYSLLTANSTDATPARPAHPILNSSFFILNWTYTFSAKEKDPETGLSYFGSRYYSSDLSIWLSVDPMAGKYPSLSPYVYCANNPIKLVDPNGEDWYIPENSTTPVWDKDVTRKNCPQNATYLGVEGCTYDGKTITHYQKDGEIKQYSASNSIRKGGFTFPVGTMTDSYKSGYAQFGTNRSNGTRKHAGCDLYAAVGTPVFAVSQGTVFEKAHFYKGTYSIAINHGTFSARYCELIPSFNVQVGMQVAEGDFIGMIGKMEGLSQSMLHFEMYNNSESGPLTNKTNGSPYFRRGDLMNPTSFLDNIRLGDYEKVPKCIYR